jgi:hypothetical protein
MLLSTMSNLRKREERTVVIEICGVHRVLLLGNSRRRGLLPQTHLKQPQSPEEGHCREIKAGDMIETPRSGAHFGLTTLIVVCACVALELRLKLKL